jgi:coniferyl-aldehyde dehydrogenase
MRARLQGYLDDAAAQGAHIVPLVPLAEVKANPNGPQRLAPTLILQTTESMKVMQEEIFGPLLPDPDLPEHSGSARLHQCPRPAAGALPFRPRQETD